MNINQSRLSELGYEAGTRVEGTYSARMDLGEHLPVAEIVRRIGSIVAAKASEGENLPVSGFIPAAPEGAANTVLFACDPNRAGNPTPEECLSIVPKVVTAYQEAHGEVGFGLDPVAEHFRTLPGLVEGGYNPDSHLFTRDEVLAMLPKTTRTDSGLSVVNGTVWSARYRQPDWDPHYYEAGIDVRGPEDALDPVLQMVSEMRQDRVVFEITGVETQVVQRPREA